MKIVKIIRGLLYSLAISTGMAGLLAGGVPLAKFALQYLHDHEYGYYYDANSLYLPEIVFLLSVILLVFIHISFQIGKKIYPADPPKPESSAKPTENSTAPANDIFQPAKSAEEKLARLLKQQRD
jgi:hypothetical protein